MFNLIVVDENGNQDKSKNCEVKSCSLSPDEDKKVVLKIQRVDEKILNLTGVALVPLALVRGILKLLKLLKFHFTQSYIKLYFVNAGRSAQIIMESECDVVMTDNKNVDEVIVKATEEDTKKVVNDLKKLDEKSEKQKKRLKRKVRVRNITIIALIVIIIILLLRSCSSGVDNALINRIPIFEDSNLVEQTTKSREIPRIDIPVVTDASVSADQPYVNFYNPESNVDKYYLQYEVYDENAQLVYQSKIVEAGKKFSANLYEVFQG